jgi:lysophospholipase L1-like esterase
MLYQLIATALSPVLPAQGLYARKNTPRLPEPTGERHGVLGKGPAIRVLILGDSSAAGVGVSTQAEALSGQLTTLLAEQFTIAWQLWARNGFTSQNLHTVLDTNTAQPFDVVLISIGVNDITSGSTEDRWIKHQHALIEKLTQTFSAKHIVYSSLPPMHLFPALPNPLRWVLGMRAKQFNRALEQLIEQHPNCQLVQNDMPMQAHFIASDGFHPSATSYTLWAKQVSEIIKKRVSESI